MAYRAGQLDAQRSHHMLVDDVRHSMSGRPRALPRGMPFDAIGHALYARVTALPNFTMARAEAESIRNARGEILELSGRPREIVDLRAGTATGPRSLLDSVERYVAVESCHPVLRDALDGLAAAYPRLDARGIVGDSAFGLESAPRELGRRLILLLGGELGRLDPTSARLELARLRGHMEPDDRLLLGMDLDKEEGRLAEGYDDATDVYAAYVRNALRRSNREIGTDFRIADWRLVVEAQPEHGRVETRFEARGSVTVRGGRAGEDWEFVPEEPLVVERAYKPSEGQVAAMALGAGFCVAHAWRDFRHGYGLFLLSP